MCTHVTHSALGQPQGFEATLAGSLAGVCLLSIYTLSDTSASRAHLFILVSLLTLRGGESGGLGWVRLGEWRRQGRMAARALSRISFLILG